MSLREKLLVLVLSLVTTTIVAISLILGWSAQKSTAQQTEKDGILLAKMIAKRAGSISSRLPDDLETVFGEQMLQQARLIAAMVALGQNDRSQLQAQLIALAKAKGIVNISWLDSQGTLVMGSSPVPDWDASKISPEIKEIIAGTRKEVLINAQSNAKNDHTLRLVAVSTSHQPGVISLLYNLSFVEDWKKRLGYQQRANELIETGVARAIWFVDSQLRTLGHGSADLNQGLETPTDIELDTLEQVINKGEEVSIIRRGLLRVMSPVVNEDNKIVGAALIHLPTEQLDITLSNQLYITTFVAIGVLILALMVTYAVAQWLGRPVTLVTQAARSLEQGTFNPDTLDTMAERPDEFGKLAAVFQIMGQEIQSREEKLDLLVKMRTKELEGKTSALEDTLSELKTTQNQLIAKEKLASLGQLTSGIAHELKNPLNFVINFSNVTMDTAKELADEIEKTGEVLPQKQGQYIQELARDIGGNLKRILEHGYSAEGILNKMIQHAAGSGKTSLQKFDFNHLIRESVVIAKEKLFKVRPDYQKVTIEINEFPEFLEITVVPTAISQALEFLLDNALYATLEKAETASTEYHPLVQISLSVEDKLAVIKIEDNGTGIGPEIMDQIFNPFFTTKPTRHGNTGMGLSLSYDIITQQHQGQLEITSTINEGTTVIVKLPFTGGDVQ